MKYLVCENCKQVAVAFEPDQVSHPVHGGMFISQYAGRGMRPPWVSGLASEWLMCGQCGKRVFHDPNPTQLTVSDNIEGTEPYVMPLEVDHDRDQYAQPAGRN